MRCTAVVCLAGGGKGLVSEIWESNLDVGCMLQSIGNLHSGDNMNSANESRAYSSRW